jgi:hypothetical protein
MANKVYRDGERDGYGPRHTKNFNPNNYITVFTDASYCDRTGKGGMAAWIKAADGVTHKLYESFRAKDSVSAEKQALQTALDYIIQNFHTENKTLVINCDCMPVLESLDVEEIEEAGMFLKITLKHVKAHRGVNGPRSSVNTWCDSRAKEIMRLFRDQNTEVGFTVEVEDFAARHRDSKKTIEEPSMQGEYKTFNEWKSLGRIVCKGERSHKRNDEGKAVFHYDQTDSLGKSEAPRNVNHVRGSGIPDLENSRENENLVSSYTMYDEYCKEAPFM